MLCAVLVLLLIGYLLMCAHGRWLAPAPFFALLWAVALAAPPLLAPDFVQSQGAVWYIAVLMTAFGFGALIAGGLHPPTRDETVEPRPLNLRLLRWLVAIGTVCGLGAAVFVQSVNGYSVGAILSAQGLLDAAAAFSVDRYSGNIRTPPIVPLLTTFTYAAALLAPFAAQGLRRRGVIACYLGPFLGASVYAVVTTARLGMLTVGFFLFAGWIAASVYSRGAVPRLRLRSVLGAAVAFAALAGAFVSIAFLRVGSFDLSTQRVIVPKMVGYAVGYMPAFSQWLPTSPTWPHTWGTSTFGGLMDIGSGESAAFTGYVQLGGHYGQTNIFTAWRYLIEDFGLAGAPLVAFVMGWVAAAAWRRVVQRPTPGPLLVLLCAYAYMLNSTTQTVFLFTNIILAIVVTGWALYRPPPKPKPVIETPHERDVRRTRERLAAADVTAGATPRG